MDIKDLDPTREEPPQTTHDGIHDGVSRQRMEALKAQLHRNVDSMFDSIEYAPDGHAINPVTIEGKRDFESLAVPSGRVCYVPKASSMTLKIERTAAQFKRDLDKAVAEEPPYDAPMLSVTPSSDTIAETLPPGFRQAWRETARRMYDAYGNSVGWKAVSGHPMPAFDDVGARVEGAWCIAAAAGAFHAPEGLDHLLKTKP